jgi:Zn-dependent M28 family amino/carboxypeptidase
MALRRRMLLYVLLLLIVPLVALGVWTTQPVRGRGSASKSHVDPSRLREHVRRFSQEFSPRSCDHATNLTRCVAYLREALAAAGGTVEVQPYRVHRVTYENVVARFGPADGPRIVVGAHYDGCGLTPGADDNASGVAGLIELAGLLGQHTNWPVRIELAAYCTEEPPYFGTHWMGSYQHAERLAREHAEVRAMLCLEMIGCFSDRRGSQLYPLGALYLFYPRKGNFIALIGNPAQRPLLARVKARMKAATDLPVRSASVPRALPGVDFSDHRSYWAFGFPAVMVTDTSLYRNSHYHENTDTWDTLDYDRMAKVVVGVYEAVALLADGQAAR